MLPTTELLTTAQVAARLGVTVQTVINRMKAGKITAAGKLPTPTGTHLFDPAEVDRFLAEQAA